MGRIGPRRGTCAVRRGAITRSIAIDRTAVVYVIGCGLTFSLLIIHTDQYNYQDGKEKGFFKKLR